MKKISIISALALAGNLVGCSQPVTQSVESVAPGAPGDKPFWAYSGKTGIGTSYEAYHEGRYSENEVTGPVSKVWFSIAQGIITESMFGLIHEAQIRDMQFVVVGDDFTVTEKDALDVSVDYLYKDSQGRPLSLAYKVVSKDPKGRFSLEKHIFTDPDSQTLFVRSILHTQRTDLQLYVNVNPYVNNSGIGDTAFVAKEGLVAHEADKYLTLQASKPFALASVGFTGQSDNLAELKASQKIKKAYQNTGQETGNINWLASVGKIKDGEAVDFALSFGLSEKLSFAEGEKSLKAGYQKVLSNFNGVGEAYGWEDYLASLKPLNTLYATTTDNGKLLNTSAMVLKAQEDKTYAGALIASLSNPWGDTVSAEEGKTGYKAVWVRDFYQVAMAFMAMGDTKTALTAFEYLQKVQVSESTPGNQGDSGWFLQKTHVDGELEWVGVQLDQTAMPIMLAWKLWQAGELSTEKLEYWYFNMLKPAADFLVHGGKAKILWNDTDIKPPMTQQERWEEQPGYSPSTTAAVIAGLITASDIAKQVKDDENSTLYLATAMRYDDAVEETMFTTKGTLPSKQSDGQYFIRIGQDANPNSDSTLNPNNGRIGMDKKQIIDGGFLELVRYGVRQATAPSIVASLPEYDDESLEDNLRVHYSFSFDGVEGTFPGYRRYGNDGYGEDLVSGANYASMGHNSDNQRGRVWPFFTGERGHYELAAVTQKGEVTTQQLDDIRHTYVKGMELFANEGMMLPEQVWDNVGKNTQHYQFGEGTNSATPLAWTHAEYVKLIRSVSDKQVWDYYPIVEEKLNK
ncbi:glycoside hydrolase family 15 protein [Pseudoalteromonas xiamenensis]|uniref:glycoside hydrolase family 15 protein n=1 Tax=Pseudoalteromonas xiamenensis TaxID=882626 RepID=UPI0035EC383C